MPKEDVVYNNSLVTAVIVCLQKLSYKVIVGDVRLDFNVDISHVQYHDVEPGVV